MAHFRTHRINEVLERHEDIIKVNLDDGSRAYALTQLVGAVEVDDEVIVNTTAVDLSLGTGGWHFIVWNLSKKDLTTSEAGHIMKMRYTPLQINVGVAEEFDTWDHESNSLENTPVIVAPLHSHIPAIASYIKKQLPQCSISVLISDGAALPVALSDLIRTLKTKSLIDTTVSFGHAFGGDIESINIFTALLAARNIANADYIIVTMGPGIVGTHSRYGFTGMEVAYHLDTASLLGGTSIGVLRASCADPRERHRGISHHALTTYSHATHCRHTLGLIIDHKLSDMMKKQLETKKIPNRHSIIEMKSIGIVDIMEGYDLNVNSMGRSAREDELFYEMAAISARIALREHKSEN